LRDGCHRREAECEDRASIDGAPGMLDEAPRDGGSFDDGIAPVIQGDQLGKQFGAKSVTVAADPVDLEHLAHQATATRSGLDTLRQRRRWCWAKSSAKSCSALRIKPTAPSG